MQSEFRKSNVARIGRSYPRRERAAANPQQVAARAPRRYRFTAAIVALVSIAGLLGWLRFR